MEDYLKVKFAKVLDSVEPGKQPVPGDCPTWMVAAYTRLCGLWSRLLGNRECNQRDYPLLTLVAECDQRLETRIATLELRVTDLEQQTIKTGGDCTAPEAEQPPVAEKKTGNKRQLVGV